VARAKRTNRAEARRRYRAQVAEQSAGVAPDAADRPIEPSPRAQRAAPEARPTGMRYALRAAFHRPDLRDDLAHAREIVGSRALWAGIGISVATALAVIATNGSDFISRVLAQYFLFPPPIGAIFIAGFFSRRASYISGLVVAVIAAVALQAVLTLNPASIGLVATTNQPSPSASPGASAAASVAATASASSSLAITAAPSASGSAPAASASPAPSPSATPQPITPDMVLAAKRQLTLDSVTTIPLSVFFASAAAWYRRFLRLGNPNRPPARGTQRGKGNNRRR
jgi:hypothetical protein